MDPLHQFDIQPIIPLTIGGVDVSFSNSALFMVLAVIVIYTTMVIGMRRGTMVPGRMQSVVELVYEFVAKTVKESAGPDARPFVPFMFSLFTFILVGNLLGIIPGSFTFTTHVIVTFSLGVVVITLVTIVGLVKHGLHFFSLFMPHGAPLWLAPLMIPIEVMSYFVRPLSLAVRLFANMMAGHTMLKVFASFAVMAIAGLGETAGVFVAIGPVAINVALIGFELMVKCLQAYVFLMLSCLYLRDAIYLHD